MRCAKSFTPLTRLPRRTPLQEGSKEETSDVTSPGDRGHETPVSPLPSCRGSKDGESDTVITQSTPPYTWEVTTNISSPRALRLLWFRTTGLRWGQSPRTAPENIDSLLDKPGPFPPRLNLYKNEVKEGFMNISDRLSRPLSCLLVASTVLLQRPLHHGGLSDRTLKVRTPCRQ